MNVLLQLPCIKARKCGLLHAGAEDQRTDIAKEDGCGDAAGRRRDAA